MKKLFIIFTMSVCFFTANASSIYCELIGTKIFSATEEFTIYADFGEYQKIIFPIIMKNDNGITMRFHSFVDAMNWMDKKGWKLEHAYTTGSGSDIMYHWILSKEVDDNDVIINAIEDYKKQKAEEIARIEKQQKEEAAREERMRLEYLGIDKADTTMSVEQLIEERTNELKLKAQKMENVYYVAGIIKSGKLNSDSYGILISLFSVEKLQSLMRQYSVEELEQRGQGHDEFFERFKKD